MKTPSSLQNLLTQSFETERILRHFSALASQELITLLASALGDLPMEDSSWEPTKKNLERAIFLTRNIRYFSSGARADFTMTDLSKLFFDCLDSREPDFKKKNISLDVKVEASIVGYADPLGLEQAFFNLLDFASSHATPESQVALNLQVVSQGLQLSVSLEGASESEEENRCPLEPCSLPNLEAENLALLGLFVCSVIFEAHSGRFQCFKSKAEGVQLVVQLPFDPRINKPHLFREKRRYQRVSVDFPVNVFSANGKSFKARMTVLSSGGAFIAVNQKEMAQFKCGDLMRLDIQTDAHHSLSIPVARVANTQPKGENSGIGLEFIELDTKAKNLLAALVKAHAS